MGAFFYYTHLIFKQMFKHRKLFTFCFIFCFLSLSCTLGGLGGQGTIYDNVVVGVRSLEGSSPVLFTSEGGTKICRRGIPDISDYKLDPIEVPGSTEENTEEDPQGANQSTLPITADVGENWFAMGLFIASSDEQYWLVIEQLSFFISLVWGNELLEGTSTISSGYCNSDPLYIIPPLSAGVRPAREDPNNPTVIGHPWDPQKISYYNNLTLYVDGLPFPEAAPVTSEENDALTDIRAQQQTANSAPTPTEGYIVRNHPPYQVQLIISGQWIDKQRNTKRNFKKEVRFQVNPAF